MKHYPSIDTVKLESVVWVFDKIDGSNIRAEWSKKRGIFYKFGSRKRLIDESEMPLGKAISIIRGKYEKKLNDVFQQKKYESAVCFFEFVGPSSFAGQHKNDEEHDAVLFDIAPFKKGLLSPEEFLKHADGLDTAKLLYQGVLTNDIERQIKEGSLPGLTFEGVVCKAPGQMSKIKTSVWLNKLKEKCGDDERLFKLLS